MGPNNIKLWKCKDDMTVEYRERVKRKYEELDAEKGTVEGEWRPAVQGCICWGSGGVVWKNVGERRYTEKQKPRMVDGRGGEGSGGKASDMIECIKKQRGPTNHQLKSPVWPEEEGSQEGGGHSTEEYGRRTVPKA